MGGTYDTISKFKEWMDIFFSGMYREIGKVATTRALRSNHLLETQGNGLSAIVKEPTKYLTAGRNDTTASLDVSSGILEKLFEPMDYETQYAI